MIIRTTLERKGTKQAAPTVLAEPHIRPRRLGPAVGFEHDDGWGRFEELEGAHDALECMALGVRQLVCMDGMQAQVRRHARAG